MSEESREDRSEDPNRRKMQSDGGAPGCRTPRAPECHDPATCGPSCCTPVKSSNRAQWLVFLLVMAAAGVVLIYGLLGKEESGARPPTANGLAEVEAPGWAVAVPEGSDALFVLLPGDDEKRTLIARNVLSATVERIRTQGPAVAVRTLQRGQDGYAELVEQFAVSSFPCVIALGRGCGAEKVGEISESHLIRAFVIASQPPSGCIAGSACCPSPCGK